MMEGLFEKAAVQIGEATPGAPVDVIAQVSIAISLKRIADYLEPQKVEQAEPDYHRYGHIRAKVG